MPKIFARQSFSVVFQTNFGSEKNMDKRGYQDFLSATFCLRVPKTFVGEHFFAAFEKNCRSEKLSG